MPNLFDRSRGGAGFRRIAPFIDGELMANTVASMRDNPTEAS